MLIYRGMGPRRCRRIPPLAPHRRDVVYLPFFSPFGPPFWPGLSRATERLALDDEIISITGEAADGSLGTHGVSEGGEPLVRPSVGAHDHRASPVALGDDLMGVAAFLSVHEVK